MIVKIYRNNRNEFLPEVEKSMYRVRVTMSKRYGMLLPIIDNVVGKRDVRILPTGDKKRWIKIMRGVIADQRRREDSWIIISEPDSTAAGYDEATQR